MRDLSRSMLIAATGFALAACGAPASVAPSHAVVPSGDRVALVNQWAGICADNYGPDKSVEGRLVAGRDHSASGGGTGGWTYLVIPAGAEWPTSIRPDEGMIGEGGVAVFWPDGFTGTALPEGELAVFDSSGNLVAVTGSNCKLKVQLPIKFAAGYPDATRFEGMQVCPGSGTVISE